MKAQRKDTLFLETTEVPAAKSIGEITAVLVKAGAREISTTYDNGEPAGVRWSMMIYHQLVWFQLPVRVEPVFQKLRKRLSNRIRIDINALRERATRVAWRQLLIWVKVQMAMVELDMAEFAQVFLPYVLDSGQRTMWDAVKESQFKQLEAPKS
jgi:hypothetical protein